MNGLKALLASALLLCLAGCASAPTNNDQTAFNSATYYAAGQIAETQQNDARAIQEYHLALNAKGPHTPSLYRLGVIYTQLHDYPQAIEFWNQYVTATYGSALAYGDLAYALQSAGEIAQAKTAYETALQKEPANPTVRVNYGLMLAGEGDIAHAQNQLRGILPEADVHYQIGIVCQNQKNLPEARSQFGQAIALNPQLLDAKARLAEVNAPK